MRMMTHEKWLSTKSILKPAKEDEADMRMRLMLEATPLNCTLWDPDGGLIDCNGDTLRMYGLSKKSDYLEHFYDFNPEYQPNGESTRDAVKRLTGKVLESGYERINWMSRTPSGEELPFESTLVRVPWKGGYRLAVYSRDLREEKAKETALQESEKRLQAMLDNMSMSCFFVAPEGKLLDCNEQALKTFGFDSKEELLEDFFRLSPEYQSDGNQSRQQATKYIRDTFETGNKTCAYWEHKKKDGTLLPMEVTLVRIKWNNGYRLIAYHRDLTEIIKKEAALQETENRLQAMLDNMSMSCFFIAPEGKLLDCNEQALKTFGFDSKEELLEDFYRLSPEYQSDGSESRQRVNKYFRDTFETGKKACAYWEHKKKDGTLLPMEVTLVRTRWKGGYRLIAYHRDLSQLIETEDQLKRVLAVVEGSPNFNIFLGNDGTPQYLNPAVLADTGYSREELLKNGLSLVFSPEDFRRFNNDYLANALKDKTVNFEMPVVGKSGVKRDFLFSAFPAHLNNGSTGVGVLGRDITELKQIQRDLAAAKEQAEHALASEVQYNKAKSDFLSRVSHELRTPLNAIVGITNVAKNLYDKTELEHSFEKISIASEELLHLINNVLDLTSFDTGKFDFRPMLFSLRKALQSVIGKYTKKAGAKSQYFVAAIDNRIQDQVIGDERRVKQVLDNLLSNAVKFTPEKGHIELFARMKESSDNECVVCFDVADDGIGIAGDVLENLGEIFEQADNSITRAYGGMGLGLALTKRIVKMMQGDIKVESEPGKGSRFSCTLRMGLGKDKTDNRDRENAGGNTGETRECPASSVDLNGKRILIVDDVELNREVLRLLLQNSGAALDEAADGEEAVRMFSRNKYDLVFMDIHMPVMNGYNATKNIRALPLLWASLTPIISVSAESSMELHAKCREVGINDHIPKPVAIKVLYEKIAKWLPQVA